MSCNDRAKALIAGMRHFDTRSYDAYGGRCETTVPIDTLKAWALPEDLDEESREEPRGLIAFKVKPVKSTKSKKVRDSGY